MTTQSVDPQSVDPKSVVAEWINEAAVIGQSDAYDAKRSNKRFEWYQQMEMLVDGETTYINCRDIGTGGIGVSTRIKLREHSSVMIRRDSRDPWIPCRVAHCTQSIGKSSVGLQLDFVF
ncbi:MAG: hypothetical protein DHS20C16_05670 [Phycisphaerae bacterium]|nr:MAG: hypothetical protein DHS20C16_05670 [Phycisphaerae bacterium]